MQTNQPNGPSPNGQTQPAWRQVLHGLVIGAAVALAITVSFWLVTFISSRLSPSPAVLTALTQVVVDNVTAALKQHRKSLGHFPAGSVAQVSQALRGTNTTEQCFLNAHPRSLNEAGELLDAWKRPIRIVFTNSASPLVYSFGPNGKDDHGSPASDDVVGR